MAEEKFEIQFTDNGSGERIVKIINKVGSEGQKTEKSILNIKNALTGLAAGLAVREVIQASDAFTRFRNSLLIAGDGSTYLQNKLLQLSRGTVIPVDRIAETFREVQDAMHLSSDAAVDLTEKLTKLTALSGKSGSAGVNQLLNAIEEGPVSARQLRSILRDLPELGDQLEKTFGRTRGELLLLAQRGQIDGDTLRHALEGAGDAIDRKFKQLTPTLGDAFAILKGDLELMTGELAQAVLGTDSLAKSIAGFGPVARESFHQAILEGATLIDAFSGFANKISLSFELAATRAGNAFIDLFHKLNSSTGPGKTLWDVLNPLAAISPGGNKALENLDRVGGLRRQDTSVLEKKLADINNGAGSDTTLNYFQHIFDFQAQGPTKPENKKPGADLSAFSAEAVKLLDLELKIKSETKSWADQQAELNRLLDGGRISGEEFARALREVGHSGDSLLALKEGFTSTFRTIDLGLGRIGQTISEDLVGGLDAASRALSKLATSGDIKAFRQAMSDSLRSVGEEILSTIIKTLILKAVISGASGLTGLLGGTGAGLDNRIAGQDYSHGFGGFRAAGGDVFPGRSYVIGERGPEIFQPSTGGVITPNGMGGNAPPVNVTVAAVFDEKDVGKILSGPTGHVEVLKIIQANKAGIKALLGS